MSATTSHHETFVAAEPEAPTAPVGSNNVFSGLVRPVPQQAANDGEPGRVPAPPEPETPARTTSKDRQLMAAAVGPRLQIARELSSINQTELALALALGYENSTQISIWEKAARTVPLHQLVRASTVLGVSLDFLCGLCDDPTRDPAAARRRAYLGAVRAQIERLSEEIVGTFEVADRLTGPDAENFRAVVRAADTLAEAIQTLQRLNGGRFDDLRGGSPVVAACHAAQEAVLVGKAALRVHDAAHGDLMKRLAVIGRGGVVDEV